MTSALILNGDSTRIPLADKSVQVCVTSPPYFGLRSYVPEGHELKQKELGLEQTPDEYVANMVQVFREVWRVLKDDGVLWLNLGDSYVASATGAIGNKSTVTGGMANQAAGLGRPNKNGFGLAPKNLIGIPWRVAFALQTDGWYLRSDIIWSKPNPMPESVTDRPTRAHEYIFLMTKAERYFYDYEAVKERAVALPKKCGQKNDPSRNDSDRMGIVRGDGVTRNRRSVWEVSSASYEGAHFATFPPKLIEPCILAGSRVGDIVLDPFNGSGTTGEVAMQNNRRYVGIELNPAYIRLTQERLNYVQPRLMLEAA